MGKRNLDGRKHPFFWHENRLIDDGHLARMGSNAFAVYSVVVRFAGTSGQAWPSLTTIAKATGLSRSQVIREVKRLRRLGYIVLEAQGGGAKSNVYRVADLDEVVSDRHRGGVSVEPGGISVTPGVVSDRHRGGVSVTPDKEPVEKDTLQTPPPEKKEPVISAQEFGREVREVVEKEEIEAEIQRRKTRAIELEAKRQNLKAHQRIAQAVLEHGGKEVWASFVEVTRTATGMREAAWQRWMRMELLPQLERLGASEFSRALAEAVAIASRPGIRSPAAIIVKRLKETPAPSVNGAAEVDDEDPIEWAEKWVEKELKRWKRLGLN